MTTTAYIPIVLYEDQKYSEEGLVDIISMHYYPYVTYSNEEDALDMAFYWATKLRHDKKKVMDANVIYIDLPVQTNRGQLTQCNKVTKKALLEHAKASGLRIPSKLRKAEVCAKMGIRPK